MSEKRVLIVADPVETFQPKYDSSLLMASELLKRDYRVDYLSSANFESETLSFDLQTLPVQRILDARPGDENSYIDLDEEERASIEQYAIVLQRKDPPVDTLFIRMGKFFSASPAHIVQVNNPGETFLYSEHLLPAQFPEHSIPTKMFEGFEELGRFLSQQDPEAEFVLKPLNACSGLGIEFFKPTSPLTELIEYWQKWGPGIILQPFQDCIADRGDLRVIVMNNRIVGSVLRRLAPGKRLANLHQGATAEACAVNAVQTEAIEKISPLLSARGLYLLGFDFIGDKLSEINITSTSAMMQVNAVMNKRVEIEVVDEIENLVFQKKSEMKKDLDRDV